MGCVRMHHKDEIHFVTNRCEQEQFLLIPHKRINELVLEWLARAMTFVGENSIELFAYVVLSNHFHLLLRDKCGKLAAFMAYFQGNLARAVNKELGRHGKFFAREYDDQLVTGDEDFIDRYRYTTCNAVKAGLVEHTHEWKGVCSFAQARSGKDIEVTVVNRTKKHNLTRHGKTVDPSLYTETHTLKLTPPPMWIDLEQAERLSQLEALITAADQEFRDKLENRAAIGMAIVLGYHYTDRPQNPARRPRRLVFSKNREQELRMLEAVHAHNNGYRETYAEFVKAAQTGKRSTVEWPVGSYPPSCAQAVGFG